MMNSGMRPRDECPEAYGAYQLARSHGRFYAVPDHLDIIDLLRTRRLFGHPALLSAATLDELRAEIDRRGPAQGPTTMAACGACDLVEYGGRTHAVRRSAGLVDLDLADDRRRGEVLSGDSPAEVEQALAQRQESTPVEFAGWLPVYDVSGNCGKHPQFAHADRPPPGYRFTCSGPATGRRAEMSLMERVGIALYWIGFAILTLFRSAYTLAFGAPGSGLVARWRVIAAMLRLMWRATAAGAWPWATLRFIQTRHLRSQLMLGRKRGLVFLTSMPYTLNQFPWVIEIEDPTTLFYPLIQNGHTCEIDFRASIYFPVVKALLEADECKGIVTHMRSTAELVRSLFGSEVISRKVVYAPMGVRLPALPVRHTERDTVELLFINSWCQVPSNFYLRGGLDVLEAFRVLRGRYPNLRLTMRTALPELDAHYHCIIEGGGVRVIDRFVTADEMARLHAESDVYLLPAARVHIVSLLQAMGHGLAVVASDGWGFEEYVEDGRNGLIVRGRYGRSSWADVEGGALREDYATVYTPDPAVIQGIIAAVTRLIEEPGLRQRLGREARNDVETVYTLDRWNRALGEVFDAATGRDGRPCVPVEDASTSAPSRRGEEVSHA